MGLFATGLSFLSAGVVYATAPPASAAFTGSNGPLAFVSTRANGGSFGGIFEVDSQASGLGSASGDQAATSGLTNGGSGAGIDAEPFFSPSGSEVFFSSNRDAAGVWAIYGISQGSPEPPGSPTELSQVSGSETNDDYAPSVASDGRTVVFNRNGSSLDTLDAGAANPASTVCSLYTPAVGLAAVNTDGGTSRALFNPVDPTKVLYIGGDGHLHLVTGLPVPAALAPTNPCGAVAGQAGVVDTDLSAKAIDSLTSAVDTTGTYQDENADWSPDGTTVVFDSTRGGTNHTLWVMTNIASGTTTVTPLWPSQVGSAGGTRKSTTEPVFSPDGTSVAFVEPGQGVNTWTGMIVGMNQGLSNAQDVSLSTQGNGIVNDQPDWGPSQPSTGTPEVPMPLLLPGSALVIGGLAVLVQRRRRPAG
jgi:Tol biopolymer transport system component